jgi:hypothetical protein
MRILPALCLVLFACGDNDVQKDPEKIESPTSPIQTGEEAETGSMPSPPPFGKAAPVETPPSGSPKPGAPAPTCEEAFGSTPAPGTPGTPGVEGGERPQTPQPSGPGIAGVGADGASCVVAGPDGAGPNGGFGGAAFSCSDGGCLVCHVTGCFACDQAATDACAVDRADCGGCRKLPFRQTGCLVATCSGGSFACSRAALVASCDANGCPGCTKF